MSIFDYVIQKSHISQTRAKILANVYWAVLGKFVNLLSALVVGIMVARYLGPEQYGLMNYVISYVVLFQTISLFGLDSIEVREESKAEFSVTSIIGTAFTLKIGLSLIFMALVILTSWQFDADRNTLILVSIYSLVIPLNAFSVIRNYFTAIVQNKFVVKVEIVQTLVGMVIKVLLLWFDATLIWFVLFSMFDYVLSAIGYSVTYHYKVGRLRLWHYNKDVSKYMLKESFPLLLTNTAVILYQRIDQVMIGQMIDKESVGYFSVASRFVEILIYIPMILSQTIMPILVQQLEDGVEVYEKKAQQFMNVSLWLSLLTSAIVSVIAYWLIIIAFGKAYLPAVAVLQVMSFKAASVALSNTAGAMLVAEGLQRYAFYRDCFGCIVCIALNWILLPRYGIVAAAFVAIFSNVAAGYLADAIIPAYRHLFVMQTKALFTGWRSLSYKNLVNIK